MELTQEQFRRIEKYLPVQRGNVKTDHYTFLQALLYMIENGGKWRRLPQGYGKWNSVYQRASRWAKSGTMERVFIALQKEHVIAVKIEILALDSTSIKVHPDAHGALKKTGGSPSASQGADGTPSFMWYPRMTRPS
jgi:transposase